MQCYEVMLTCFVLVFKLTMRVATQTVDESDGEVSVVAAAEWPSGMTV